MSLASLNLPDDIARHLASLAKATGRSADALAQEALSEYIRRESWQIAEIQRAVALSAPGGTIEPSHLSPEIGAMRLPGTAPVARRTTVSTNLAAAIEQVERELIQSTLDRTSGNISETARVLGLTTAAVRQRVHRARLMMRGYLSHLVGVEP